MKVSVLILSAGKGERMRSQLPKVLHKAAGRPLLYHVLNTARSLKPERVVLVVGYGGEMVREAFPDIPCVEQKEQLGTAHAVLSAEEALASYGGNIIIMYGDTPLITPTTMRGLVKAHTASRADLTLLYARMDDPKGYGRVIFGDDGRVIKVIEELDATPKERRNKEINVGVYITSPELIFDLLKRVKLSPRKEEYKFTDVVEIMARQGRRVLGLELTDPREGMGVNSRRELANAERVLRERTAGEVMDSGVTLIDPERTYIDTGVRIGKESIIYPNTYLMGDTVIGKRCVIEPNCFITDTRIGDSVTIRASSVITESVIGKGARVGPMAHLRPGSIIGEEARIGNFVEVKKTNFGARSKANHLTYLGDAIVGADVNIGAGTITCNYDGVKKHQTIIEDGVFVGSDTMFVAPVKIGRRAVTGAGSTITKDVPPDALAIARAKQVNIEGWRLRKK